MAAVAWQVAAHPRRMICAAADHFRLHGFHKAVTDDHRVQRDDRQLDIAAVTFADDDRHLIAVDGRLQHGTKVFVLHLDHSVAATGARHSCQRWFSCLHRSAGHPLSRKTRCQ